ncbi:hypothetical protein B0H14DRAFT_2447552 [Mycena olivaceomarginata]|nr:hypothetical protein B0H14DRAFT_2447552 [Mycena olivaceomarginata]
MTAEKASVMHFAHFWHQQGTAVEDMGGPSHDMRGSSGLQIQANKHYFLADESAKIISSRFKAVYPEYHASYQRIFDAGVFLKEDPGPFPARAIVYKLQVYDHRDDKDEGPSATSPSGYWKGGSMCYADLRTKLLYGPGDIVFSMGGDLYHSVEAWEAIPCPPDVANARITPGRISTVFFCPEKTARALEDKPPGWASQRGVVSSPILTFGRSHKSRERKGRSSRRSTRKSSTTPKERKD